MKKAREVAMATLKDDDDENYCVFLMDFINMNLDFCANEEYEIDMLLKVHEDLIEVKKKLDSRGKLFEGFSDDKAVKIETIKYECLKRTKRRQACHTQGVVAVKLTYQHAAIQNPELKNLMDCMESYALAANDVQFGDVNDAMNTLTEADKKRNALLADANLKEDERVQFDLFYQQCGPFISEIQREYKKQQAQRKKRLLKQVSIAALVIGAVSLTVLFVQQRKAK
jgi:hypothetical protein